MTVSHPEDLALVRRAVSGDRQARQEVAERLACVGRMVTARNRSFGGALDADSLRDVAQDVVARVLTKLPEYGGLAAFESWVFVFCEGELRNAVRRQRRAAARATALTEAIGEELAAAPLAEPSEDVHLCVQALAAEDQQLVRWKHFEDLTLGEIGQRLDRKLNTVKSRYFRILQALRRCLERRRRGGAA